MAIMSGWREQHDRMMRSYSRLVAIATGKSAVDSEEARDALFHFFQDAYHLKDWIKHDPLTSHLNVEEFARNSMPIRLCADLCNGTKHFALTKSHLIREEAAFTGQSVTVRPAPAGSRATPSPALHGWTVDSKSSTYDALVLAEGVTEEWTGWLTSTLKVAL